MEVAVTRYEIAKACVIAIRAAIENARSAGVECDIPRWVEVDGIRYFFDDECFDVPREQGVTQGRVITKTMTDGIRTKDGAA
jgi:hypothetical protein